MASLTRFATARRGLLAGLAALALVVPAAAQFPGGPCWETNLGVPLSAGNETESAPLPLGFAFPLPGTSRTTHSIIAGSNGYVWLDHTDPLNLGTDWEESVYELLLEAPRIAVAWANLTAVDPAREVYFNTFSNPARAVVTWDVLEQSVNSLIQVQLQLYPDGSFSLQYQTLEEGPNPGSNDVLVGVSPGHGAADPGPSDLSSARTAIVGGWTVYEMMPPQQRDLEGSGLYFLRTNNGYTVLKVPSCSNVEARSRRYGTGCPHPTGGAIYEFFYGGVEPFDLPDGTSIRYRSVGSEYVVEPCPTNCFETQFQNQVTWDRGSGGDLLSSQSLPFAASYGGVTTGGIVICSNGFVWLTDGSWRIAPSIPSPDQMVDTPFTSRLAALWTDLNPTAGGGVYFDTFPASGTIPARAVVTWHQVPQWLHSAPGAPQTVQAQFFADGDIIVSYQNVDLVDTGIAHGHVLTGFTIGGTGIMPPETDFSAGLPARMPFAATDAMPMSLDLVAGQRPAIGTTMDFEATELHGATAVAHLWGFQKLNVHATPIGMAGCTLLVDPVVSVGMPVQGGVGRFSFPVPNVPALIDATLSMQAIAGPVPSVNALGLIASNGLELTIGV